MNKTKQMKLCEFADINPPVKLTQGEKYPCVMMDEITPGRRYVFGENQKIFSGGAKFQKGDVLFARITPCLENGKIAQFMGEGKGFGSTEYFIFRERKNISDQAFLFYLASSDIVRKPAEKSMFGASGRQRADLNVVMNVEVPAPSLPVQRRIANILSAYDDLIENNTRRIRILEQMAQALYQEWFGKVEKESLPDGWTTASFTDIIDVLGGGTPKTDIPEYWDGDIPWFTPRDLTGNFYVFDSVKKITEIGLSKCNSKLYPTNTVFITARGTVGKCVLAAVPMAMSQTNYALIGKNGLSQYFVFLLTLSLVVVFKQNATGAVFDTIITDTFRKQTVIKPPPKLVEQFHKTVEPIFGLILNLQQKNANLRQTRDLLLPRLVSGEIAV